MRIHFVFWDIVHKWPVTFVLKGQNVTNILILCKQSVTGERNYPGEGAGRGYFMKNVSQKYTGLLILNFISLETFISLEFPGLRRWKLTRTGPVYTQLQLPLNLPLFLSLFGWATL